MCDRKSENACLNYVTSLAAVNRQWGNEVLRQDFKVKSNAEILMRMGLGGYQDRNSEGGQSEVSDGGPLLLPFSCESSDAFGRYFVSSRDVEAGEVLLIEPSAVLAPLVFSPLKDSKIYCVECLREPSSPYTCERCGFFLCGKECDTDGHGNLCLILRSLGLASSQGHIHRLRGEDFRRRIEGLPSEERISAIKMTNEAIAKFMKIQKGKILHYYPLLAVVRTLLRMEGNPRLTNAILSLQGNVNVNSPQFAVNTQRIVHPIMNELKLNYTFDYLHEIASIWDTNGFEASVEGGSKCQGLYPASSFLTHSCLPNCEHTFAPGGVMVLRAVEDIPPGTILTICYTDQIWPTHVRVDHLLKTKNFKCSCPRCLDPTELGTYAGSILCRECFGFVVGDVCNKCAKKYDKKETLDIETRLSHDLKQFGLDSAQGVRERINSLSQVLPPNHHLVLRLKVAFLSKLKNLPLRDLHMNELEAAEWITSSLLEALMRLYVRRSRLRARVLRELLRIREEIRSRNGGGQQEILVPESEVLEAQIVLRWYGLSV